MLTAFYSVLSIKMIPHLSNIIVVHCVFGITFMLKIEASVSQMVSKWDQNQIKLSRFHNSINFDKIPSTAGWNQILQLD